MKVSEVSAFHKCQHTIIKLSQRNTCPVRKNQFIKVIKSARMLVKMLFLLLIGLLSLVIYLLRHVYTYWQRKGFPYYPAKMPFGCLDSVRKGKRSLGTAIYDVYNETTVFRPALLIRNAEMTRQILVQDFPSFHDRGIYVDEANDPFSGTLFALQGNRWKTLRTKLTPFFTSGKLKGMFPTLQEVGTKMVEHLDRTVPNRGHAVIELKELFSTYAIDIIGSVVFGLNIDSFQNPGNKFREISRRFMEPNFSTIVRGTVQFLCPSFEKLFVFLGLKQEAVEAMKDIVRQTVEYREKNNISRRDIMQMLIQLRNTGKVNVDDNIWDIESSADGFKSMSIESIAGQAFLFYVAGYETSASTAAFTIYELAQYPEVLSKVQKDITDTLAKHDGKLTYESIQEMKYLDLCIMETIRKYPALPILNRECTKDYQIPGTDKIIEKGTPIIISLLGMHRDPEYFPEPLRYDPERFLESNHNYNPMAYMPFGEGPRHCIAQRMGQINVKVGLVKILTHYNIVAIKKGEIELDTFGIPLMPKGGVNVNLSKINA